MLRIIYGAKGCGKTSKVILEANIMAEKTSGNIVFITDTNRYKFELKYHIRLINVKNFDITTEDELIGFVKGVLASNSDIDVLYIDGAHRITNKSVEEMEEFYNQLDYTCKNSSVEIVCTASTDKLPDFLSSFESEKV